MQEIDQNAKSVNPKIKTIPEIYAGIEEAAVVVGADVYSLYPVLDGTQANGRTPLNLPPILKGAVFWYGH